MKGLMALIGLVALLVGFILTMRGMWLRKPDHPSISGLVNWRVNLMPWRYKDYWEPSGYQSYFAGIVPFELGVVIIGVSNWLKM